MQTTQKPATKTKKARTAEERKAAHAARWKMLKELAESMEAAKLLDPAVGERIEKLAASAGITERNASLVLGQCPQATEVKSFKAWKAEGRTVMKGQKALYVLAPAGKRKAKGSDAEAQEEKAQEEKAQEEKAEGEEKQAKGEEKQAKGGARFVAVPVFDRSQTEAAA